MILRSPAENENGVISFHMALSSTRHSRPRTDQPQIVWLARAHGNPGSLRRIKLDTRFRGYDGTQAGLLVLVPKQVFSKEHTKITKGSYIDISKLLNFVLPSTLLRACFVTFVVKFFFSTLVAASPRWERAAHAGIFISLAALPPRIAIRSASLNPGVLRI